MNFLATLTVDLFIADPRGMQGRHPVPTYSKQKYRITPGGAPSVTFGETSLTSYLGRIPAMVPHLILTFTHSCVAILLILVST